MAENVRLLRKHVLQLRACKGVIEASQGPNAGLQETRMGLECSIPVKSMAAEALLDTLFSNCQGTNKFKPFRKYHMRKTHKLKLLFRWLGKDMSLSFFWVAVQELNVNYHNEDVKQALQ